MFKREDENYVYEIVSKNIQKQRKLKGLTQEQLAEKIEYSTQFISNIESKKNHQTMSLGTLWRIALILDIDIALLFKEDKQNNSDESK
ncbi:MAG: helix-turn-helix domain-containing protein [Clostridia bacterium]|nr:helix-turn-helix domain-containing protein [Clostridia bacterium]